LYGLGKRRKHNEWNDQSEERTREQSRRPRDGMNAGPSHDNIHQHRENRKRSDPPGRIGRVIDASYERVQQDPRKESGIDGRAARAHSQGEAKHLKRTFTDLVAHRGKQSVQDIPDCSKRFRKDGKDGCENDRPAPEESSHEHNYVRAPRECHIDRT
jgi:hypothetical protein